MKTSLFLRMCLCLSLFSVLTLMLLSCGAENPPPAVSQTVTTAESQTEAPLTDTEAVSETTPATETAAETRPTTEPDTAPETNAEEEPLMLNFVSYNIAAGRQVSYSMRTLAGDLKEVKADIVGIQEVDQNCDRSGNIDTVKLLSRTSGLEHYAFFKGIDLGAGEYGVAILSKYPILETERVELSSNGHEQRVVGRALIDVNGTHINFFVTHLSYEDKATRTGQFAELAAILSAHAPYVLVGDFNTADFDEYAVLTGAATVNDHDHSVVTFPQNDSSIDNIVYTADRWQFGAPAVRENDHSDHYMLYAQGSLIPTDTDTPAEGSALES